jgi:hypothetical protein
MWHLRYFLQPYIILDELTAATDILPGTTFPLFMQLLLIWLDSFQSGTITQNMTTFQSRTITQNMTTFQSRTITQNMTTFLSRTITQNMTTFFNSPNNKFQMRKWWKLAGIRWKTQIFWVIVPDWNESSQIKSYHSWVNNKNGRWRYK